MDINVILGDYAEARALKAGDVRLADGFRPQFRDGHPISHFRRFVSELDADIAEIPLMTFLSAWDAGIDVALLPVIVLSRFQHPFLVHDSARGPLTPRDLEGRRIAIRAYSVTTAVWVRDILQTEHGVDPSRVEWVAFEEPHVATFRNPPNVVRAPEGASAEAMLAAGDVDAAVLRAVPQGGSFRPVIENAESAGIAWGERHGAVQINHMLCVPRSRISARPKAVAAFGRALVESSRSVPPEERRFIFGRAAVAASLEKGLDCALRQGVIAKRPSPEELTAGNGIDDELNDIFERA